MYDETPSATDTVTTELVAIRLGVDPATLTNLQRARIAGAILDAQTKAEEEIGRGSLVQRPYVLEGVWPTPGYAITDWRAWPVDHLDDYVEVQSVDVASEEDGGAFTVHLLLGIDGAHEAPIQRFILADAVESLRADPTASVGERSVKSVSAEGQSITWVDQPSATGPGAAPTGSAPSIKWLRKYKPKVWIQRPAPGSQVAWPYSSSRRW